MLAKKFERRIGGLEWIARDMSDSRTTRKRQLLPENEHDARTIVRDG